MIARASPKLSPVRTAAAAAATRGLKMSEAIPSAARVVVRQHPWLSERLKAFTRPPCVRTRCSPGQAQRGEQASLPPPPPPTRKNARADPRRAPGAALKRLTAVVTDGECSARPGAPGLGLEPEPLLLPPRPHRAAAAHQRFWADTSQRKRRRPRRRRQQRYSTKTCTSTMMRAWPLRPTT
jgi:hypothetical protein